MQHIDRRSQLLSLILVILLCDIIPIVIIARVFPSLVEHAPKQRNYRGAEVLGGLGIVWFVWLVMIWACSTVLDVFGQDVPMWVLLILTAFPLLSGTCALGLFDDWVGDSSSRGFKGHFRELRRGVLTTGMVKLLGIGVLSLATAILVADLSEPWWVLRVVCACFTIALFANMMNLFDLRPLRASKIYILCLVLCTVVLLLSHRIEMDWLSVTCMLLACLGPVMATWRFDAHEIAMLGDAGANTMGALLGFMLSVALPIWLLVPLMVALFAINLLSERVSFTKVIERIPVLRHLDGLFRPKELLGSLPEKDDESGDARYDGSGNSRDGGNRGARS